MRILLADDQEDIRLLAQQHLENSGHQVVTVANGQEALRAIRQQPFDAVLLDEEMPPLTGTQVLRTLRSGEKQFGHPIVLALTGYNSESDTQRLLQVGFDAVLAKPFRLELLETVLRDAVTRKTSVSTKPAKSEATPALLDPLARLGGNVQLLCDLARIFLRDLPPRFAKLQKAIRQERADTLVFEAHALKGSLSIFGAERAGAICSQLQECGKAARFADAARTFASLKEAIAELEPNLRRYAEQKRTTGPGAPPPSKSKRRPRDSK